MSQKNKTTDPLPLATGLPSVMDYDPNLTSSGRMAKQIVKLVFGLWKYRTERSVTVGGNCTGLHVIGSAVSSVYNDLKSIKYNGKHYARITLTNSEGDELECEDEDYRCHDWLSDMLVGAEIVAIAPGEVNT